MDRTIYASVVCCSIFIRSKWYSATWDRYRTVRALSRCRILVFAKCYCVLEAICLWWLSRVSTEYLAMPLSTWSRVLYSICISSILVTHQVALAERIPPVSRAYSTSHRAYSSNARPHIASAEDRTVAWELTELGKEAEFTGASGRCVSIAFEPSLITDLHYAEKESKHRPDLLTQGTNIGVRVRTKRQCTRGNKLPGTSLLRVPESAWCVVPTTYLCSEHDLLTPGK